MISANRRLYLRQYQLAWIKRRRQDWINTNGPCVRCSSWDDLEVDHRNHEEKLYNVSSLWALAPTNPKRVSELEKCQVLCADCHGAKTAQSAVMVDVNRKIHSTLTAAEVREIRDLRRQGLTYPAIAKRYRVDPSTIGYICRRKTWNID